MRGLLLGVTAAAALGGCAALPVERPWDLAWSRSDTAGEGARLVLGVPGRDDLRLMLACQPHSGAVEITAVGGQRSGAVLEIHSGEVWNRYPGAGYANEETQGATDIEVRLSAADPVLQSFADTGELTVVFGDHRLETPNAFAPAHDFLALCRLP